MARPHKSRLRCPPDRARLDDLYDYVRAPACPVRRQAKRDRTALKVTDDWPGDVPVTEAEIDVFESWFGDLFDELIGKD